VEVDGLLLLAGDGFGCLGRAGLVCEEVDALLLLFFLGVAFEDLGVGSRSTSIPGSAEVSMEITIICSLIVLFRKDDGSLSRGWRCTLKAL